jgi:hypothetical protein
MTQMAHYIKLDALVKADARIYPLDRTVPFPDNVGGFDSAVGLSGIGPASNGSLKDAAH